MKIHNINTVSEHIKRDIGLSDYQAKNAKVKSQNGRAYVEKIQKMLAEASRAITTMLQPRVAV